MYHAAIKYAICFINETSFVVESERHSPMPIELKTFCAEVISFSHRQALREVNCRFSTSYKNLSALKKAKQKEHLDWYFGDSTNPDCNGYKFIMGALGEILVMVWMYLFGYKYDIQNVLDTSDDKFARGLDFMAAAVNTLQRWGIQVKMRTDENKVFSLNTLFTMMDELEKQSLDRVFLVVPTSSHHSKETALSFNEGFNKNKKVRFIGQRDMVECIKGWEHPTYGKKLGGFWNFFQSVVTEIAEAGVSTPKLN